MREYPVAFRGARILTGEEEGAYGWITINYLLDSFTKVGEGWNSPLLLCTTADLLFPSLLSAEGKVGAPGGDPGEAAGCPLACLQWRRGRNRGWGCLCEELRAHLHSLWTQGLEGTAGSTVQPSGEHLLLLGFVLPPWEGPAPCGTGRLQVWLNGPVRRKLEPDLFAATLYPS